MRVISLERSGGEIFLCDQARRREVAYMDIRLTDLYLSRGPSCVLRAKRAAASLNACWPVLFLLPDVSLRRRMRPAEWAAARSPTAHHTPRFQIGANKSNGCILRPLLSFPRKNTHLFGPIIPSQISTCLLDSFAPHPCTQQCAHFVR